jgi:hypothetical protein
VAVATLGRGAGEGKPDKRWRTSTVNRIRKREPGNIVAVWSSILAEGPSRPAAGPVN